MADGSEGWVRVHSDEDENKSDEEFIVRNLLHEMVEKFYFHDIMHDDERLLHWWKEGLGKDWEPLINEYAAAIALEYEHDGRPGSPSQLPPVDSGTE
jgi:hypothetical protein